MTLSETQTDSLKVTKDISDTYIFDRQGIEAVEAQFRSLLDPGQSIEAKILLEGGNELKGTSAVALLDHPLLNQIAMEGFSLGISGVAGIYDIRVARIGAWLNIFSDDTMRAAAASEGIMRVLKNARAWYRPIYRFDGELLGFAGWSALFFWCMLQAFEIRDPNWLWGVAGLPAYALVAFTRRFLFRQLEFKIGLAGKKADFRFKTQAVLGGGVLLAFVVGLATNFAFGWLNRG